jgi:hypothetical protein
MTDRELLELAAKAAGMDVHWGSGWESDYMFRRIPRPSSPLVTNVRWDPITYSGDAFELAVKLRINLTFYATALLNTEYVYVGDSHTRTELHLDDLAATRRAIVRAAAEIGKEMK